MTHVRLGLLENCEHMFVQWNEDLLPKMEPRFPAMVPATVHKLSIARDFQRPEMRLFGMKSFAFLKAGKSVTFATNNSGAKHNTSVVHTGCQLALCPLATCWQERGALLGEGLDSTRGSSLGGAA